MIDHRKKLVQRNLQIRADKVEISKIWVLFSVNFLNSGQCFFILTSEMWV